MNVAYGGKGVKDYCGVPFWKKGMSPMPQNTICCQGLKEDKRNDCDFKYWPTGPGWEDILDFMRDEDLWLKHYLRAWHIATENGMKNL